MGDAENDKNELAEEEPSEEQCSLPKREQSCGEIFCPGRFGEKAHMFGVRGCKAFDLSTGWAWKRAADRAEVWKYLPRKSGGCSNGNSTVAHRLTGTNAVRKMHVNLGRASMEDMIRIFRHHGDTMVPGQRFWRSLRASNVTRVTPGDSQRQ